MLRGLWVGLMCISFSCSGGGASSTDDLDGNEQCTLVGEQYSAYYDGDGARCEADGSDSSAFCRQGDRCASPGVCEFVTSAPEDAYCAMLDRSYDAFYDGSGTRCEAENSDSSAFCLAGDWCASPGRCQAVLSASFGVVHTAVLAAEYDAYYDANGNRCEPTASDTSAFCQQGDRCASPGTCEAILSAAGGTFNENIFGQVYDAFYDGTGVRCEQESSDSSAFCKAGDRCVSPGGCEVVLSAISR